MGPIAGAGFAVGVEEFYLKDMDSAWLTAGIAEMISAVAGAFVGNAITKNLKAEKAGVNISGHSLNKTVAI